MAQQPQKSTTPEYFRSQVEECARLVRINRIVAEHGFYMLLRRAESEREQRNFNHLLMNATAPESLAEATMELAQHVERLANA